MFCNYQTYKSMFWANIVNQGNFKPFMITTQKMWSETPKQQSMPAVWVRKEGTKCFV